MGRVNLLLLLYDLFYPYSLRFLLGDLILSFNISAFGSFVCMLSLVDSRFVLFSSVTTYVVLKSDIHIYLYFWTQKV